MTTDDTGAALNRKIAEARGWMFITTETQDYLLFAPSGNEVESTGYNLDYLTRVATERGYFPDWANDASAALALCQEIAVRHVWVLLLSFEVDDVTAEFVEYNAVMTPNHAQRRADGDTPALALARLALSALTAHTGE